MATKKSQRIGIAIILAATVIGTVGSFAIMILGQENQAKEAAVLKKQQDEYQVLINDYTAKLNAQNDQLSAEYYPKFSGYASRVGAFDRDSVTALVSEDLLVGDGAEIDGTTKFNAYYILWKPDGSIVEQSIDGDKLKASLAIDSGLDAMSLIDGWKEGMKGMKIGGVRELTIPSDKAYKDTGRKDANGKETIAPNTPLKFIVMAIPTPEATPYPQMPEALLKAYYGGQL